MRRKIKDGLLCLTLILCFAEVLYFGVGKTLAYLSDGTHKMINVFQTAFVPPVITEEFDGMLKENVRIQNDGNVPAYVRAFVAVSWQDADGNPAAEIPKSGTDYEIRISSTGWSFRDGCYYCVVPVMPGAQTPVLITAARQLREKEGYALVVEILAQTVQAEGEDHFGNRPVELAWGVDIADGAVTDATVTGREG